MASEEFQPLLGMSDIAGPEVRIWQRIEDRAREVFELYGYEEVRTPILERVTLFVRSLGDSTEVVQKEMYAFTDRGGRDLAMRPEGTASVIRYVARLGQEGEGRRLYYSGPMFRAERPAAGRKRQFHQIGTETIGAGSPMADAEVIAMQMHLLSALGLRGHKLHLNTRGLPEDRVAVAAGLRARVEAHRGALCEDCQRRLDANVLRVLDCKNEGCRALVQTLPPVTEFMSAAARQYLADVLKALAWLEIDAVANPLLIRGLDYYVHTVWEITHPGLGAQDALAGGGRYRIALGGRDIEGVGFAMGMERLVMAMQHDLGEAASPPPAPLLWIVSLGERALAENLKLAQSLRQRGVRCGMDLAGRSMKAQMREAHRSGALQVIIRGDQEIEKGVFMLKNMADGSQSELDMPALMGRLRPGLHPA